MATFFTLIRAKTTHGAVRSKSFCQPECTIIQTQEFSLQFPESEWTTADAKQCYIDPSNNKHNQCSKSSGFSESETTGIFNPLPLRNITRKDDNPEIPANNDGKNGLTTLKLKEKLSKPRARWQPGDVVWLPPKEDFENVPTEKPLPSKYVITKIGDHHAVIAAVNDRSDKAMLYTITSQEYEKGKEWLSGLIPICKGQSCRRDHTCESAHILPELPEFLRTKAKVEHFCMGLWLRTEHECPSRISKGNPDRFPSFILRPRDGPHYTVDAEALRRLQAQINPSRRRWMEKPPLPWRFERI
jgi:hypothetical protein